MKCIYIQAHSNSIAWSYPFYPLQCHLPATLYDRNSNTCCHKIMILSNTYHSAIAEGPIMNGDALVLEGLCPVGGFAASHNIRDIVALQFAEVEW